MREQVLRQVGNLVARVRELKQPRQFAPLPAEQGALGPSDEAISSFSLHPSAFDGVDERLATVRFRVDDRAHIQVNNEVCKDCSTQACVYACPANLFTPLSDGTILFNYEQCFECGTCYVACNKEGAITWTYPRGGYGVSFREA